MKPSGRSKASRKPEECPYRYCRDMDPKPGGQCGPGSNPARRSFAVDRFRTKEKNGDSPGVETAALCTPPLRGSAGGRGNPRNLRARCAECTSRRLEERGERAEPSASSFLTGGQWAVRLLTMTVPMVEQPFVSLFPPTHAHSFFSGSPGVSNNHFFSYAIRPNIALRGTCTLRTTL